MSAGNWQRLRERLLPDPPVAGSELPQAAVLVLIDELRAPAEVVLTRRAEHLRLHAGEIAFPGGKCDDSDRDHWHTALRESEEEIGLRAHSVESLGVMQPLVTRTGIEVTPCVARLSSSSHFVANPQELDEVFTVPLEFFSKPENLQFDRYEYGGRERQVPRYEWRNYTIWGITAAVLVKLVNLACDAGLEMEDYWQGR
ncbi:MAG: CoA pyrophosphatase [Halieaceae bacterium]